MGASWQLRAAARLLRERGLPRAAMAVADCSDRAEEALVLARLALGMTCYELACRGYDEQQREPHWLDQERFRVWDAACAKARKQAECMWLQLTGYYTADDLVAARGQLANQGKLP